MRKGKLYNDKEWVKYQMDIKHPFHDTEETFEAYECPECGGHFLVESEGVECADRLWCPYCHFEFTAKEEHECIVKAEDEDDAIMGALEQAVARDTKVDEFGFRVEKEN